MRRDGVSLVREALHAILVERQDVLALAVRRRARFEGWLKWELAARLSQVGVAVKVEQGGHDLALWHADEVSFLELKTVPTNWIVPGVEQKQKRITDDVDAVVKDLGKIVARVCPPQRWGAVAFCLFPVPKAVVDNPNSTLYHHLKRIETGARVSTGALQWEYIPIPVAEGCGVVLSVVAPFKDEFAGVLERIVEDYQPEAVYLYGSFAWGTPHLDSDFDLLVVKETKERPIDRRVVVARIVSHSAKLVPVEAVVLTPQELAARRATGDHFVKEMVERGTLLYAKPTAVPA